MYSSILEVYFKYTLEVYFQYISSILKVCFTLVRELWKFVENDICWCKSSYKTTRNKRSGGCILQIFIRSSFKTWNTMSKRVCIFHLFLVGIPSILILSIKNRWEVGGGLLNGQNLLSVTKVICWQSFSVCAGSNCWL